MVPVYDNMLTKHRHIFKQIKIGPRMSFDHYSNCCIGEPRKMKLIINCYMFSRSVVEDELLDSTKKLDRIFRDKMLKLLILCEQWPCRMSWLFIVIDNLQQE